jgi:hypothetical protein
MYARRKSAVCEHSIHTCPVEPEQTRDKGGRKRDTNAWSAGSGVNDRAYWADPGGDTLHLNARAMALRTSSYPHVYELINKNVIGGKSAMSSASPRRARSLGKCSDANTEMVREPAYTLLGTTSPCKRQAVSRYMASRVFTTDMSSFWRDRRHEGGVVVQDRAVDGDCE